MALYVTAGAVVDPLLHVPATVKLCVAPVASVVEAGLSESEESVGAAIAETVIAALLLLPFAVAVTFADPALMPVTRPALVTAALAVLELVHASDVAGTGLPATSVKLAASCIVLPCCTVPEAGVTVTLASGPAETVTVDCPETAPAVAETTALPVCAAVATPEEDTLTIEASELFQLTVWPVTALPELSVRLATSCCVVPATRLADPGVTETVLTVPADTVTAALALAPPAEAVMFAFPECTAVTRPLEETVATELLELDHATV